MLTDLHFIHIAATGCIETCFIQQNQQRELTVRHARETEKEMKKRLDVQKEEYEEAIKRHLSFIDQVITNILFAFHLCKCYFSVPYLPYNPFYRSRFFDIFSSLKLGVDL